MTGTLPEPERLRGRLGREEFTQKLLTCLILGRVEKGWNRRREPSAAGSLFLHALHATGFGGESASNGAPLFVDEFELPKRSDAEPAGWPDYGVVWPERLFVVELKTERTSHRATQIPYYLELAGHWHPTVDVDLMYVTPAMTLVPPTTGPRQRFRHLSWAEVAFLIESTWSTSDLPSERQIAHHLIRLIANIEASVASMSGRRERATAAPASASRSRMALPKASESDLERGLALAAQTEADGRQRALEIDAKAPEVLEALRVELRDRLVTGPMIDGVSLRHVLPWVWREWTSDGRALTELGREQGCELRLSRNQRDVTIG